MIRKTALSAMLFATFLTTELRAEEPAVEASAWPRLVTVEARVDFADLDLGTPAGAAEARRRLTSAVRAMCRPDAAPADASGGGRIDGRCVRQALAGASGRLEQAIAARTANVQTALNATPRGALED